MKQQRSSSASRINNIWWCFSPRGALVVAVLLFFAIFMIFADLRGAKEDPVVAVEGRWHETKFPGHTLRATPLPADQYAPQPSGAAAGDGGDVMEGGPDDENQNKINENVNHPSHHQRHHPYRDARLAEARRPTLDPDLNEWPFEDEILDQPIYNYSTKRRNPSSPSSPTITSPFISHLEFKGKCWYHVTNFCVVRGDLVLYHDPADKATKKDSLRMCNEFSQRSATIRLKYKSEPMPDVLPGPLLEKTPGWVLQFWCQDLFHSTLSLMPAYQTRLRHFNTPGTNNPDVYLRLARGIRKKGQYCHIKFGHPLSYNESHNKRWGGDKQFPFAGNPYWKLYKALSSDPWRIHPLYKGSTQKTACYRTGVIDKLYVKHVTRRMARQYSDEQLKNLEVPAPEPRQCGKYRITIIDRRGKTRRLTNVEQIAEIGRSKVPGFAVVKAAVFENLTIQEQISLIANTDLLLGMHGNGLTWQQFMQHGSCLIELCHTWYMPYAKLFGHSYFHSSLKNNPTFKKHGEYVPFAHNETEIEQLLIKAKAALDKTSCGGDGAVEKLNMDEQLDYMYKDCAPHC